MSAARCPFYLPGLILAIVFPLTAVHAQDKAPKQEQPAPVADAAPETPQQKLDRAWQLLTTSATDAKHTESRIQAQAALSTLKGNARAEKIIVDGMHDLDMDVRTAAILAAGKTKSPAFAAPLRKMLDDTEPEVVFAAATTLWSDFKDRAGEDILVAVADGNRKASPSLLHGAKNDMNRTMHSPSAMAKIGVQESAGLLLGPFGFSIAALEYMHKNGSDSARVKAMELLAEDKGEAMRQEMVDALTDNDPGVRAAAAKVLGELRLRSYATAVGPLIDDAKLPVRLTAAAAYINCMSGPRTAAHPAH